MKKRIISRQKIVGNPVAMYHVASLNTSFTLTQTNDSIFLTSVIQASITYDRKRRGFVDRALCLLPKFFSRLNLVKTTSFDALEVLTTLIFPLHLM